jgi:hypothetical protein
MSWLHSSWVRALLFGVGIVGVLLVARAEPVAMVAQPIATTSPAYEVSVPAPVPAQAPGLATSQPLVPLEPAPVMGRSAATAHSGESVHRIRLKASSDPDESVHRSG